MTIDHVNSHCRTVLAGTLILQAAVDQFQRTSSPLRNHYGFPGLNRLGAEDSVTLLLCGHQVIDYL